jgi:hypothetical protein
MTVPMSRWLLAGLVFCCSMLAIHIVAGFNSAGVADFWRDMYWATLIAHGESFPLSGPPIYQLIELGPWWFYLLAVPIWLTHRVVAAAIFVQILAAMKYFLAWRIGTRAIDARFGFAFAVSLAASRWALAPILFPTHSALTETTILLLGFATWRFCDHGGPANAALFGLAASACLHAHPSTSPYIVLASSIVLWQHRSWHSLALLCLSAAIVLLSLAPPFFDTQAIDDSFRTSISSYVSKDLAHDVFLRVVEFFFALSIGGLWSGLLLMTRWSIGAVIIAWIFACLALTASVSGTVLNDRRSPHMRRWVLYSLLVLFAQVVFLVLIRPTTPIWMVPSCLLPLAFTVGAGFYRLMSSKNAWMRTTGLGLLLAYGALGIIPFRHFLGAVSTQRMMSGANPYWDIVQNAVRFDTRYVPFVPVRHLDVLSKELCAPVTLHALLGKSIEQSLAVTVRNACDDWPDIRFGGNQPGRHIAGINARVATSLGITPDRVVAQLALFDRPQVIAPELGSYADRLRRMQVTVRRSSSPTRPLSFEFDTIGRDVVSLTNRFENFSPTAIHRVSARGSSTEPIYVNASERMYRCASCSEQVPTHWTVELDAIEENIDLVVLKNSSAAP